MFKLTRNLLILGSLALNQAFDVTVTCPALPTVDIRRLVLAAAVREGLRPAFAWSVAFRESRFKQHVVSSAGAVGVMQLKPQYFDGVDVWDAEQNVTAGVRYLAELVRRFKTEEMADCVYSFGYQGCKHELRK